MSLSRDNLFSTRQIETKLPVENGFYFSAIDLLLVDNSVEHEWEVERESLELTGVLGEGAFGVVQKAQVQPPGIQRGSENYTIVAVKMIKGIFLFIFIYFL